MNRFNRSDKPDWVPPRSSRLLDQVRERIRYLHYSLQTEKVYVYWAKVFVLWAARTHSGFRQALNALLFLYRQVLGVELPWMIDIGRPPERKRIPVVLSPQEVQRVLELMTGTESMLASLLYGSGLRLREALGLRMKDIDFDRHAAVVRSGVRTAAPDKAAYLYPMRWSASTRVLAKAGPGFGCFPRHGCQRTRKQVWYAATICLKSD